MLFFLYSEIVVAMAFVAWAHFRIRNTIIWLACCACAFALLPFFPISLYSVFKYINHDSESARFAWQGYLFWAGLNCVWSLPVLLYFFFRRLQVSFKRYLDNASMFVK